MSTNLPTRYQPQSAAPARGVEIRSLGELQQFAQIAAESGLFKDLKGAAQAAIKIQRGLELGLAPMEAMSSLHVMEGKVTMSAQLMAAMVRRAGYRYRIEAHDYQRCELRWFDPQGNDLGCSSFSLDDAQKAGLAGRGNWSKFAREMLFARAVSQGARWFAPEVLLGCYLPDELEPAEPLPAPPSRIAPSSPELIEVQPALDAHPGEGWQTANRRLRAVMREASISNEQMKAVVSWKGEDSSRNLLAPELHEIADAIQAGPSEQDRVWRTYCHEQFAVHGVEKCYVEAAATVDTPWKAMFLHGLKEEFGGE